MSADNEIYLKRVLRVFRNAIVGHIRTRLRDAFGKDAEARLATLYGKKESGSSMTQWERMKFNADRARATPEVSTMVADDFELLGVSDFYNVFERFFAELARPIGPGEDVVVFNDGKKGLLRCLQQVKVYRDPNAHDVSEPIDADSLLLCILNCKKVCDSLSLGAAKKILHELHEELVSDMATKHATLLSLAPESEAAELSRRCLVLAGVTFDVGFAFDLSQTSRLERVVTDFQNLILAVGGKVPGILQEPEVDVLNRLLVACERQAITPLVLISHYLTETEIESNLSEEARRAFKRAERLPLIDAYADTTARKIAQLLRHGAPRRARAVAPISVPVARAVHDNRLAPLIFGMIRDPQLLSARIVAPFATDIELGPLGLLSEAMINAKKRGCRICLITRPPVSTDVDLVAKQRFLRVLYDEQIELYVNSRLHAKVYLFERDADRKFWAVGSHNLTNFAHDGKSLETSMVGYRSQEYDEAQTSFERARRHAETLNFSAWARQMHE